MIARDTLLEMFWAGHDPSRGGTSQYRAELYCDQADLAITEASRDRATAQLGHPVATRIVVGRPFYPAEAYHQKWRLRQHPAVFNELLHNYDNEAQLLASTTAAKLNAYAGGHWEPKHRELDPYVRKLATG